jgi:alanine racemase
MPRPTYAEVDLRAIRSNCRALRSLLESTIKLMGIVKADAYGHGAVPVA